MCLIEPASERLKIAKVEVSGLEVVDAVRPWENCFPPAGRKKTDGAIQAAGRVSRRVWISGDAQPVPSPATLFGNMLKEAATVSKEPGLRSLPRPDRKEGTDCGFAARAIRRSCLNS